MCSYSIIILVQIIVDQNIYHFVNKLADRWYSGNYCPLSCDYGVT